MEYGFKKIEESVKQGATPELRVGGFMLATAQAIQTHKNEPQALDLLSKELVAQEKRLAREIVHTV